MNNENEINYQYSNNDNTPRERERERVRNRRNAPTPRNNGNNRMGAQRHANMRNEEDKTTLLLIGELMGQEVLISEVLTNDALLSERQELLTISKISRMEDEDRLKAYGKTFQKIQNKLSRLEANQSRQIRNAQEQAYLEGERMDRMRFHVLNTVKAKRNANTSALQKARDEPMNLSIRRILQQGRYAKPENAARAKNYMNAKNRTVRNYEGRLQKYNNISGRLSKGFLPYENYEAMARELE